VGQGEGKVSSLRGWEDGPKKGFLEQPLDEIYTTLFEEPQDERPLKTEEIRKGLWLEGGFFCIRAKKLEP